MYKIIVVGKDSDINYKSPETNKSIIDLINSIKDDNIVFNGYNIANLTEKEMLFIKETMNSPLNRLVVLGDIMRKFLDYNISSSRIVLLYEKTPEEIYKLFEQYIRLPKFNNVVDSKEGDIKLHHKGTSDLIIKAPKFTDKEPEFDDVPEADFSSKLQRVTKYSYFFGIDKLEISNSKINKECCYVSNYVNIGKLKENDYIQIDADYYLDENCSIEFYIVDGEKEIPILPYKEKYVQNEKLFFNMWTRFMIDDKKPSHIYKDLMSTKLTIEDAISKNDGLYTISYFPQECHDYKPKNENIQIKAIIRMYDKNKQPPYINYINIRKFGDEMVWKDNI